MVSMTQQQDTIRKLASVAINVDCHHCGDVIRLRPDLIGTEADIDDQAANLGAEIAAALDAHWTEECS